MTVRVWTGGTSGVISDATNYLAGVAPDNSGADSIMADRPCIYGLESGTPAGALVDVTISSGYRVTGSSGGGPNGGNLGTGSTQPSFGNVTGTFKIASRFSSARIFTSGTITKLVIEGTPDQQVYGVSGTVTRLDLTGAQLTAEAAFLVVTHNGLKASVGTYASASTAITTLTLADGSRLTANLRNITTANLDGPGARLITTGTTTGTGASSAAVATCNVRAGSIYNKQSAATDTTVNVIGANSLATVVNNPNQSTGSATMTNLNVWNGASAVLAVPGYVTSATNTDYLGGVAETPVGV